MASLDPGIKSPSFFMPFWSFHNGTDVQAKDYHQFFFFTQAYGTEANYCPTLDLSADNLSDKRHIPRIQDNGVGCLLKTRLRSQSSTLAPY